MISQRFHRWWIEIRQCCCAALQYLPLMLRDGHGVSDWEEKGREERLPARRKNTNNHNWFCASLNKNIRHILSDTIRLTGNEAFCQGKLCGKKSPSRYSASTYIFTQPPQFPRNKQTKNLSAAIIFFCLSPMKLLLWHMKSMPLISVTHSKALLGLIKMRGQPLILMI